MFRFKIQNKISNEVIEKMKNSSLVKDFKFVNLNGFDYLDVECDYDDYYDVEKILHSGGV